MALQSRKRCLFVVEDTFQIGGRGLVVLPGIAPQGEESFRVGDPILLVRPNRTSLELKIGGIEMLHTPTPQPGVPILLSGITREDIPVGTEIWSVQLPQSSAE